MTGFARPLPTIRRFLWGLLAVSLGLLGERVLRSGGSAGAVLLLAAAAGVFVVSFRRLRLVAEDALLRPVELLPAGRRRLRLAAGLVLAAAALILSAFALVRFRTEGGPPPLAWGLHLAGLALLLAGVLFLDERPPPATAERDPAFADVPSSTVFPLLALILLIGLLLRVYRFDSLPFGVWYDEAENGLQALRVLDNPHYRPVYVSSIHAPAHYIYLIAAAFRTWGVSIDSIRLVSVLMGLGTILAGYLAGRELFGRAGGLIAAALLAVSRWDINLSRIGMYNISTPLFALLTAGFLLRAIRRRSRTDFALAGLCLGFGLCFYAAFQLFVVVAGFYLAFLALTQRGFLRTFWAGLAIFVLAALLVVAPVIQFAYDEPEIYFARTQDTSFFSVHGGDKRWAALWENAAKHLLMFNVRGDPNGRHNLPGEPMLDSISAALMLLGAALGLWRWRHPGWLLLLLWLSIMLLGGVLSLDFEAPQSLRAVGTLPAAYLLAVVPFYALFAAWHEGAGRTYPQFALKSLPLLLLPVALLNAQTYFGRQASDFAVWNAFSTPETLAARLLSELPPSTVAYVTAFFHGHPTLHFLASDVPPYDRLETTDTLPLPVSADNGITLITNADARELFESAKRLYPNARFEELGPPFPGPRVLFAAHLAPSDLAAIQGLEARFYDNARWEGEPVLVRRDASIGFDEGALPLPAPLSAEWVGVLRVPSHGLHQLGVRAPGRAELFIGEERVAAGTTAPTASLVLAEGNHPLRLRVSIPAGTPPGPVELFWRPPDGEVGVIPNTALYSSPVTANGLLGRYFPNGDWQGPEALARIDPEIDLYFHVTPLPRPYTVEWTGKIAAPESGRYRFGLESIDEAQLFIDGQAVTETMAPNEYREGAVDLSEGLHDIRIRYADRTDHSHIHLYWAPPWETETRDVPSAALFPPQGSYEHIDLDALRLRAIDAAPAPAAAAALSSTAVPVAAGLETPIGVAAGPDGRIYVAETGSRRVAVFSPEGEPIDEIGGRTTDDPFEEPFDLAVDAAGQLYVLDSAQGRISLFDAGGAHLRDLRIDSALIFRSRGLAVDAGGLVWVANTPGSRILAFDAEGTLVREISVGLGEDTQPVDVAVGSEGDLFVTDAGLHQLIRFSADGRRLLAWDLPRANTLQGSHLAVSPSGEIFVTLPELGAIERRSAAGEPLGIWTLTGAGSALPKPVGVAVDASGALWTADSAGGALLRLVPE